MRLSPAGRQLSSGSDIRACIIPHSYTTNILLFGSIIMEKVVLFSYYSIYLSFLFSFLIFWHVPSFDSDSPIRHSTSLETTNVTNDEHFTEYSALHSHQLKTHRQLSTVFHTCLSRHPFCKPIRIKPGPSSFEPARKVGEGKVGSDFGFRKISGCHRQKTDFSPLLTMQLKVA